MEWKRVNEDLAWGGPADEAGLAELAEAGFRTIIEAKRSGDRPLAKRDGDRWFDRHRLVVDGWSPRMFERLSHLLQTGEPGPVYLEARHPEDGEILAWVWAGVRSKKSVLELRDLAVREGRILPDGAWAYLSDRSSSLAPTSP